MDNNLQDMIAKAVVDIIKQKEDNKGINLNKFFLIRKSLRATRSRPPAFF